jgi:predicted DsbA family dithiol-disulfide isomerase
MQQELLGAILRGCFEKGRCCDDLEMLADCAQAAELMPRDSALAFLRCSELRGEIEDSVREARDLGITMSPCTIIGGKWAINGGQSAGVYTRVGHIQLCFKDATLTPR